MAMGAPLAREAGVLPWLYVLPACALVGGLLLLGERRTAGAPPLPRGCAVAEALFLFFVLVYMSARASDCWLTAENGSVIPWVLLILSAVSARDGTDRARRAGATLFWLFALGMGLLLLFALPDVKPSVLRLEAERRELQGLDALVLPWVVLLLPRRPGKIPWAWVAAWGLLALVTAVIASGVPGTQTGVPGAFLQAVRGVRIFSVAERLEALGAAVLTLSWFGLLSLLLSALGEMGERLCPGKRKIFVWAGALGAGLLHPWGKNLPELLPVAGGILLWYILPILAAGSKKRM